MIEDGWIDRNQLVPAAKAHAVGLLVLYTNFVESEARGLLQALAPVDEAELNRWQLKKIIDELRNTCEEADISDIAKDAVMHSVDCAEFCRCNRNAVAHGWVSLSGRRIYKPISTGQPWGSCMTLIWMLCEVLPT